VTATDWSARFRELAVQSRHPLLRDYYGAGAVSSDTALESVPLAALDVETTGLDPKTASIVSVGIIPFRLDRIRCRDACYWVVRPVVELSEQSVTFHRITHSEIDQAPDLGEVLEALLAAMAGRVMVVHYRPIEREFLDRAVRWRLGEGLEFPVIDTMALEARRHRRRASGLLARLTRRSAASIRLADSRIRYGLPVYQAHHALVDALACAELLQAQVAHRFSPQTAVGELWC